MLSRSILRTVRQTQHPLKLRLLAKPLNTRTFTTTPTFKMPENPSKSEVASGTDMTIAKQFDTETPMHEQFEELYGV